MIKLNIGNHNIFRPRSYAWHSSWSSTKHWTNPWSWSRSGDIALSKSHCRFWSSNMSDDISRSKIKTETDVIITPLGREKSVD